jgi:hypothetical protein
LTNLFVKDLLATRILARGLFFACVCNWGIVAANDAILDLVVARQSKRVAIVDGSKYPWTSEGINQALRDACDGRNPGKVELPAQRLTGLTTTISVPSQCVLAGEGKEKTTLTVGRSFHSARGGGFLDVVGKTEVTLRDFTCDGNRGQNAELVECIGIDSSTNVLVDRVRATNGGNGLAIHSETGAAHDVTVRNSEFDRNGADLPSANGGGIGIVPGARMGSDLSNIVIGPNNRIHDNNQGLFLGNSAGATVRAEGVKIVGNVVYSNADDGINITSSGNQSGGLIVGVRVEGNESYCNGWAGRDKGPGGLGFSANCIPGFLQKGTDPSSSGVGIDIIGNLTKQAVVARNRTHDNLFDGISNDASLMEKVDTLDTVVTCTTCSVSGTNTFDPNWKVNQPVIIGTKYYLLRSVSNTCTPACTLTLASSAGTQKGAQFYGPSTVNNTFTNNETYNNATGIYNQMADGDHFLMNVARHNNLAGFYTNGGSFNTYEGDRAVSNSQNHRAANQGFSVNGGMKNAYINIAADDPTDPPTQHYGIALDANTHDTVIESDKLVGRGGGQPVNNLGKGLVLRPSKQVKKTTSQ